MDNTENDFNENLIQQLRCQNVRYEIPDRNYRNFFKSGFHYHFELHLEMPDSTTNRDLGMFMVRLIFVNLDGKSFYEINRPALLPYTSNLLSLAKIIFFLPFYLSGYQNEIHQLQIKLLDENVNYDHIDFEQIRRIRLEIETLKPIEIIAPSKLIITCQLNGIQYWMYKWPSTTSIIVISNLFVMFTAIYLLSALISFLLKMSQASRTDESFPSIRHSHHQNRLEYNSDNQRLIESDDHIETSSVTAQKQSIRSSSSLPQLSLLNDSEQ
ncbi:hypothetical protein NH340_JMT00399 [Sarcoptes scabiei]|nr:hypothetical protein NH340_JMT00399 [Sarcoptes scabiei]